MRRLQCSAIYHKKKAAAPLRGRTQYRNRLYLVQADEQPPITPAKPIESRAQVRGGFSAPHGYGRRLLRFAFWKKTRRISSLFPAWRARVTTHQDHPFS